MPNPAHPLGARTPDLAILLPCPHCEADLVRIDLGNVSAHECGQCRGLWMDRRSFEAICADPAFQASRPATGISIPKGRSEIVKYVKCPICREFMSRKNFAECSGVVIDICRSHGTWLDALELEGIVEFIGAGGVERVRQAEKSRMDDVRRRSSAVWEKQARESRGIFGKDNSIGRNRECPVILKVLWTIVEIVVELG